MQRLLVALLLLLLPLNAWAGGGGHEPQHSSRFRCLAAIEIWGPQGIDTAYYTLAPGPLDPGSTTIRFRPPAGAQVSVRTYRGWWELEYPHAVKLEAAIAAQEQQAEALDNARWRALALGAPALWPLAGGLAAAIAHPISGARGTDPYQLPWPALFDPLPDPEQPQLVLSPGEEEGLLTLEIKEPDTPYPLSGWGLVIEYSPGTPVQVGLEIKDPELTLRYSTASGRATRQRPWRRPASVDLADLLFLWQQRLPHVRQEVDRPELQFTAIAGPSSGQPSAVQPYEVPVGWIRPFSFVLLAWTGWLLGGWRLTLEQPPFKKLVLLTGGWIAGLAVAALAFPLYGLGFLPGAAVVNVLWAQGGLGPATLQRWTWIAVIWMLCSLPGLALLDQLGLVPG